MVPLNLGWVFLHQLQSKQSLTDIPQTGPHWDSLHRWLKTMSHQWSKLIIPVGAYALLGIITRRAVCQVSLLNYGISFDLNSKKIRKHIRFFNFSLSFWSTQSMGVLVSIYPYLFLHLVYVNSNTNPLLVLVVRDFWTNYLGLLIHL